MASKNMTLPKGPWATSMAVKTLPSDKQDGAKLKVMILHTGFLKVDDFISP